MVGWWYISFGSVQSDKMMISGRLSNWYKITQSVTLLTAFLSYFAPNYQYFWIKHLIFFIYWRTLMWGWIIMKKLRGKFAWYVSNSLVQWSHRQILCLWPTATVVKNSQYSIVKCFQRCFNQPMVINHDDKKDLQYFELFCFQNISQFWLCKP